MPATPDLPLSCLKPALAPYRDPSPSEGERIRAQPSRFVQMTWPHAHSTLACDGGIAGLPLLPSLTVSFTQQPGAALQTKAGVTLTWLSRRGGALTCCCSHPAGPPVPAAGQGPFSRWLRGARCGSGCRQVATQLPLLLSGQSVGSSSLGGVMDALLSAVCTHAPGALSGNLTHSREPGERGWRWPRAAHDGPSEFRRSACSCSWTNQSQPRPPGNQTCNTWSCGQDTGQFCGRSHRSWGSWGP